MDANDNKVLIKHSASIQITNEISFLARRISNVLLANARRMPAETRMFEIPLSDLRRGVEYSSKNAHHLKEAIKSLATTAVEYNIFDKDKGHEWGVFALLSQVKIKDSRVFYWYPPDIQDMLMSPNVYAQLDLEVQNLFTSKHSLALWEYLTDALGAKRLEVNVILQIPEFRKLMSLESGEYQDFCDLHKRVIQPSIKEINAYTKLSVDVEVKRKARTPVALIFGVRQMRAALAASEKGGDGDDVNRPRQDSRTVLAVTDRLSSVSGSQYRQDGNLVQLVSREQVLGRLTKTFGLTPEAAQKVLSEYTVDYIADNLDVVERSIQKGGVRNVAAYTIDALKIDYRPKPGSLDQSLAGGTKQSQAKRSNLSDEDRIEMAQRWYAQLNEVRRKRIKELFVASLNVIQINPIRELFHQHGFDHPKVMRAFMLHIAQNLEKKQV